MWIYNWNPVQESIWLGLIWYTVEEKIRVTQDRIDKILSCLRYVSGDATSDDATYGDVISGDVTIPIDPPQIIDGWCFYTTNELLKVLLSIITLTLWNKLKYYWKCR
jgi:hypothetical protein